mmetsp:Transcript_39169/g.53187  ORF Transcript_39169/g.53187 Transcript_39169/m.53187 type:complete len:255 (+) Transcript_39169:249-1013(+)
MRPWRRSVSSSAVMTKMMRSPKTTRNLKMTKNLKKNPRTPRKKKRFLLRLRALRIKLPKKVLSTKSIMLSSLMMSSLLLRAPRIRPPRRVLITRSIMLSSLMTKMKTRMRKMKMMRLRLRMRKKILNSPRSLMFTSRELLPSTLQSTLCIQMMKLKLKLNSHKSETCNLTFRLRLMPTRKRSTKHLDRLTSIKKILMQPSTRLAPILTQPSTRLAKNESCPNSSDLIVKIHITSEITRQLIEKFLSDMPKTSLL